MNDSTEILRHEPERHRFVLETDGGTAYIEYTQPASGTLDYRHTFVPTALRGGGVASRLAEFALEHALEHGIAVLPTCPFVARYIERHPRFAAAVAK
jgi:predicted GNAT family acetyltransferase